MNDTLCSDQEHLPLTPLPPTTNFAPAGRDAPAEIRRKAKIIERVPLLSRALDAMSNMVTILNGNRQIVAANRKFLGMLGASIGEVIEKRPGEAIKCIRAEEGPDGCGTGLHCTTCGAVHAIVDSINSQAEVVRECRIVVQTPSEVVPLDLRVMATPFDVEDEGYILAAIEDISHEKREAVLQRTFFHDVLNTAGCIQGYAGYLAADSAYDPEVCQRLTALSCQLIEEIQSQRDLLHAESGDLQTEAVPVKAHQVLEGLRSQYLKHPTAAGRAISIDQTWDGPIITDRQLLQRVLGNMLKNALEATSPGGTITLGCCEADEAVIFTVNNREVMSQEVQLQVFQRSFSTKGHSGRGIGTYSMKLFGERYLGGRVDFASRHPEGTTFRLKLPKTRPPMV
jgi:hypothetical protein